VDQNVKRAIRKTLCYLRESLNIRKVYIYLALAHPYFLGIKIIGCIDNEGNPGVLLNISQSVAAVLIKINVAVLVSANV